MKNNQSSAQINQSSVQTVGEKFISNNGISLMNHHECFHCNKQDFKPTPRYVLVSGVKDHMSGNKIVEMFGKRFGVKLVNGENGPNVVIAACCSQLNRLLLLCDLTSDGLITQERVTKFLSQ